MKPAASLAVLTLIGRRRTASSFLQGNHNTRCIKFRPFQTAQLYYSSHQSNTSKNITSRQSERRTIIMEDNTRYCITTSKNCRDDDGQQSKGKKWIKIAFDPQHDTTITHYNHALSNERMAKQSAAATSTKEESNNNNNNAPNEHEEEEEEIPASVLQYQRQKRKMQAANRASKTHVTISQHLQTIYTDEHIVVTNKPSGILCVPGVNSNKSLLDLVFEMYGASEEELEALAAAAAAEEATKGEGETKAQKRRRKNKERNLQTSTPDFSVVTRDNMIVHRLDMDTSGIVMFARNRHAMSKLHEAFRQKDTGSTRKVYEALLVGWLDVDCWMDVAASSSSVGEEGDEGDDANVADNNQEGDNNTDYIGGGEINLPLQRDHKHPPFMRVSTPHSEAEAHQAVADLNHAGYKKLIAKRPKASVTQFRVVKHELWMGHKVTRVELYPVTGRTHQLRVHCAALGHPILGDPAYGYYGEANPNGGFSNTMIRSISPTYATMELRDNVEKSVKESGRTMCLHAKELSLNHPVTGEWVSFSAAPSF